MNRLLLTALVILVGAATADAGGLRFRSRLRIASVNYGCGQAITYRSYSYAPVAPITAYTLPQSYGCYGGQLSLGYGGAAVQGYGCYGGYYQAPVYQPPQYYYQQPVPQPVAPMQPVQPVEPPQPECPSCYQQTQPVQPFYVYQQPVIRQQVQPVYRVQANVSYGHAAVGYTRLRQTPIRQVQFIDSGYAHDNVALVRQREVIAVRQRQRQEQVFVARAEVKAAPVRQVHYVAAQPRVTERVVERSRTRIFRRFD